MRRSIALVGMIVALAALTGCATMKMGEPMSSPPATMSVDAAMDKPANLMNKPVRLQGYVTAVCTGMPYFELGQEADDKGDDDNILVAFDCGKCKCEIPAAAVGKKAIVEGKLVAFDMSIEDQKHVGQQMGKSKEELAKINAPKKAMKVEASYAEIQGVDAKCCPSEKKCADAACKDASKCSKSCDKAACPSGAKASCDPKTCDNPKCKETGKCQATVAGKCCGSDACKKAGKCVETKK